MRKKPIEIPANIAKRLFAFVIDLVIISVLASPLDTVLQTQLPEITSYSSAMDYLSSNPGIVTGITTITLLISLIALLYFTVLEFKFKQTIGKMIVKQFVVSEQKELKIWQCLVRNLFVLPFIPFMLLWIIDPLYMVFTKGSKRFSDVLAKTKIVEYYKGG